MLECGVSALRRRLFGANFPPRGRRRPEPTRRQHGRQEFHGHAARRGRLVGRARHPRGEGRLRPIADRAHLHPDDGGQFLLRDGEQRRSNSSATPRVGGQGLGPARLAEEVLLAPRRGWNLALMIKGRRPISTRRSTRPRDVIQASSTRRPRASTGSSSVREEWALAAAKVNLAPRWLLLAPRRLDA